MTRGELITDARDLVRTAKGIVQGLGSDICAGDPPDDADQQLEQVYHALTLIDIRLKELERS